MKKPKPELRKVLDWNKCTRFIEKKYKINVRDYANSNMQYGEWCRSNREKCDSNSQEQYARYQADILEGKIVERPYQNFWHWLIDVAPINNGGTFELCVEMANEAAPWVAEILSLYLKEFGRGPYVTEW